MAHEYSKHREAAHGKARAKEMTAGYKRGGAVKSAKTTVNIVLPTQGAAQGARPPLVPPPALGTPGPGAGGPPVPPAGAGPFARGGSVKMTAGAESGEGRLQKARIQKRK